MSPKRALVIGAVCGLLAAALNAWILLRWIGFGFWYLVLVVPTCLMAMQGVATAVVKVLVGKEHLRERDAP